MLLRTNLKGSHSASTRIEWLFPLSFVTLLAVTDSLHDLVTRQAEGSLVSLDGEVESCVMYWLPCLALVPVALALLRAVPLRLDRPRSLGLHAACGMLFAYAHSLIEASMAWHYPVGGGFRTRFLSTLQYDFALDFLFYCVVVVSIHMLRQFTRLKESQLRESRLQAGLAGVRLEAIESQLNPHFFFNTLQAISVMAQSGQSASVVRMLDRLGTLLRHSLYPGRHHLATLASELEFLDGYLALQGMLYGDRLVLERHVEPGILMSSVPTMFLQPVVENSIVHGIAVKPGRCTIRIRCWSDRGRLFVEVADSGPGFPAGAAWRPGIGLGSTQSRLQLLFGEEQSVQYGRADLGGALVTLSMPIGTEARQPAAESLAELPR